MSCLMRKEHGNVIMWLPIGEIRIMIRENQFALINIDIRSSRLTWKAIAVAMVKLDECLKFKEVRLENQWDK